MIIIIKIIIITIWSYVVVKLNRQSKYNTSKKFLTEKPLRHSAINVNLIFQIHFSFFISN